METIFVYSLVLIFFILLVILASTVLKKHPYSEPLQHQPSGSIQVDTTRQGGYIILALILAGLFIFSALSGKKQANAR